MRDAAPPADTSRTARIIWYTRPTHRLTFALCVLPHSIAYYQQQRPVSMVHRSSAPPSGCPRVVHPGGGSSAAAPHFHFCWGAGARTHGTGALKKAHPLRCFAVLPCRVASAPPARAAAGEAPAAARFPSPTSRAAARKSSAPQLDKNLRRGTPWPPPPSSFPLPHFRAIQTPRQTAPFSSERRGCRIQDYGKSRF